MQKLATLAIALVTLLSPVAHAADLASVNGQPVKQAWLEVIRKDAEESGARIDEKLVTGNLIRNELLSQEAIRLGFDKQPDFAVREEMRRKELLANLLINEQARKSPVTEEMVKAEYDKFKAQVQGQKEYSVRHVLVKTEAEAKDVIARLAKGSDFAKLAKQVSRDMMSKDRGGQLDWLPKGAIKPPLGDALAKLQKGQFTTVPLKTDQGWHVLKLEDVRDMQVPPYDKAKQQLRQRLKAQQINALIDSLRGKAKIEGVK